MPNWNQPFDIYNNYNCTDNFNPFGVVMITNKIYRKYFPWGDCLRCKIRNEFPEKRCYLQEDENGHRVCKLRFKDYTASGSLVVQTRGLGREGDKESLWIRTGNAAWLYYHKIQCIYRPSNENRTMLHHIEADPFDNRGHRCKIVDFHEDIHGRQTMISTSIVKLTLLASRRDTPFSVARDILQEIKRLQRLYKKEVGNVNDSERVFRIIEIQYEVMKGNMSIERGQLNLEKLKAAYPPGFQENNDLRKMRKNGQQIIDLNSEREKTENAVQDIQQLAVR